MFYSRPPAGHDLASALEAVTRFMRTTPALTVVARDMGDQAVITLRVDIADAQKWVDYAEAVPDARTTSGERWWTGRCAGVDIHITAAPPDPDFGTALIDERCRLRAVQDQK